MSQESATALAERIECLITPSLEAMGFEVVRVCILGGGSGSLLQVMTEHQDGTGMTVEDCARVSRNLSALLDVENPISGHYTLEVSSPGLDRPLTRRKDFERFSGREAKIETHRPIDGQRRFRGRLLGLAGDHVRIAVEDGERDVPFDEILHAKLVMNDELLAMAGKR